MIWATGGFVLGAIVGSYLATVAIRWPQERSASTGRSACDGCGRVLSPVELVPILSWLVLRGRCRTCGAAVDRRHVLIELGGGIVGGTAFAVAPPAVALAGAAFGWVLLLLAVLDVEEMWLPDRLTLPLATGGLALGLSDIAPVALDRVVGAAAGFGALWLIATLYRTTRGREGMGGGDPKLMGAIGAWLGWAPLPAVLLAASVVGLAVALLAAARGQPMRADTRLPFGALLAVAAYPAWLVVVGGAA